MQAIEWTGLKITKNQVVWAEIEKKIDRTRPGTKFYYFVSGWAGLGPKFQFPFRAGLGSGRNFNLSFGLGRAQDEIFIFTSGRAGPRLLPCGLGLKNPARADLYSIDNLWTLFMPYYVGYMFLSMSKNYLNFIIF